MGSPLANAVFVSAGVAVGEIVVVVVVVVVVDAGAAAAAVAKV